MKIKTDHPRLYFDGNSHLAERSYALVNGARQDLEALGLTPESALGMSFTFVQEEIGPTGEWDALLFNGTIELNPTLGLVAQVGPNGVHWLSELTSDDA